MISHLMRLGHRCHVRFKVPVSVLPREVQSMGTFWVSIAQLLFGAVGYEKLKCPEDGVVETQPEAVAHMITFVYCGPGGENSTCHTRGGLPSAAPDQLPQTHSLQAHSCGASPWDGGSQTTRAGRQTRRPSSAIVMVLIRTTFPRRQHALFGWFAAHPGMTV